MITKIPPLRRITRARFQELWDTAQSKMPEFACNVVEIDGEWRDVGEPASDLPVYESTFLTLGDGKTVYIYRPAKAPFDHAFSSIG
ncbi:MAG: hypothetical protein EOS55_26085 [Mesorhizobium sp.]|nr:MAG: hypothetical protein EOS55_26085 [Mesorhizobium sp.]